MSRSITFPTAPPRMLDSARLNSFCPGWACSCHRMKIAAATPMPVNSQRCQPPAFDRNENAAPVLCARTMLKQPVTVLASPRSAKAACLRRYARPAMCAASGMLPMLAGAVQVADAAAAEPGVGAVLADVAAVMPAACAFAVCAGPDADLQIVSGEQFDGGCDEYELEVCAQAGQQRVVFGCCAQSEPGLQR